MRVEIDPGAFDHPRSLAPLVKLVDCFARGQHEWAATPDSTDALRDYFAANAPVLAGSIASLGEKAIVDSAGWTPSVGAVMVRIGAATLVDAVSDLCRSAVLVVEDIDNDGCFIEALARVFDSRRLLVALENRWLEIRHSGGTGRVPAVAHDARSCFRCLVRVVVVVDSDRLTPEDEPAHQSKLAALGAVGIAVHILVWREAENYVPNRILGRSGPDRARTAKVLGRLKTLPPQQRGHFDMKYGFGDPKTPAQIDARQGALYGGLPQHVKDDLRGGFGKRLLPLLREHCDRLTVRDFATLGPHVETELRALLSTIEGVI